MERKYQTLLHDNFSKLVSFSQGEWEKGLALFTFHTYEAKAFVFFLR